MDNIRRENDPLPRAEFVCSAGAGGDFPAHEGSEICIMGRSNVGKSSFINHAFGDRSLARVSRTPGKTVCAVFFRVNDGCWWVDMPGYGYARRPKDEIERISRLIGSYCEQRKQLAGVIWLFDSRHPGERADLDLFGWMAGLGRPVLPVLTKCDKLSKAQMHRQVGQFERLMKFSTPYVPFTTQGETYRDGFWRSYRAWARTFSRKNDI